MKISITLVLTISVFLSSAQYACQDVKKTSGFTKSKNYNSKSDSIDILVYDLTIDAINISKKQLSAEAVVHFMVVEDNVNNLSLDLAAMEVDSVKMLTPEQDHITLKYSYSKDILKITPSKPLAKGKTYSYAIFYHGSPPGDPSSWGGFHYEKPFYYNLGVGFGVNPHTYGRAWFPCFDNFVEKAMFSFTIYTAENQLAYCNGNRTSLRKKKGFNIQRWQHSEPIPSYLASIAISDYQELNDTVLDKPILLVAREKDTSALKKSFQNLGAVYESYVDAFGSYPWDKIGYVITPKGAMEHSTSIHFPQHLADGSLAGEDIMAHELAHHWWGNLVTCETAEDMWINEGMAEWASQLYKEFVYSKEAYLEAVQKNGHWVLENASRRDGSHLPIYGMPNELTYGAHVYQKGAMVAHNLRGYLGDSLFFFGLKNLLEKNKYGTLNTLQFQEQLSEITHVDLFSFFSDWLLKPGYPVFHSSYKVLSNNKGKTEITVEVRQTQFATEHAFKNIPVVLEFKGKQEQRISFNYIRDTTFNMSLGFEPTSLILYPESSVLTGNTQNTLTLEKGTKILKRSHLKIEVKKASKDAVFYSMYYWTGPKIITGALGGFQINPNNYWSIQGDFEKKSKTSIHFPVGLDNKSQFGLKEEYLVLLYRANAFEPWKEHPSYSINNLENSKDGKANIVINKVLTGDFALGNRIK